MASGTPSILGVGGNTLRVFPTHPRPQSLTSALPCLASPCLSVRPLYGLPGLSFSFQSRLPGEAPGSRHDDHPPLELLALVGGRGHLLGGGSGGGTGRWTGSSCLLQTVTVRVIE